MSEPLYEGRAVGQSRHDRRADMHFADALCETPCEAAQRISIVDIDIENGGRVKAFPRAVAVVDEREKERDRYTPWLHREVQGRVAGPVVQLRFISLFPWSSADQRQ